MKLRKLSAILLLVMWLGTAVASGQPQVTPVSPPDGSVILGTAFTVTLRWQPTAAAYYVDVYATNTSIFSEPLHDNRVSLSLQPNIMYRWRVRENRQGAWQDLVAWRTFRLSTDLVFHFDGHDGEDRSPAPDRSGSNGERGGDGGDGQNVTVTLQPDRDFIRVTLVASSGTRDLLLLPNSEPITVYAVGGRGGQGGDGGSGQPAMGGGDGGVGGRGGNGGKVTVRANGVDSDRYLRTHLEAGSGGKGGAPGDGGLVLYGRGSTAVRGTGGNPGADGNPGRDGRVEIQP